MAPHIVHGQSYESLLLKSQHTASTGMSPGFSNNSPNMRGNNLNGSLRSIGSSTFRSQRRRAYETDDGADPEQMFSQHNLFNDQIFDNRHHDLNFDDDLNSAGSSLGSAGTRSKEGSVRSKGTASVRTREELRLSLIARRRRLAAMESAMADEGTVDFSLRLMDQRRSGGNNTDGGGSLVSSLRDSIVDLDDSLADSLIGSKKSLLTFERKDKKEKKKKSKKKSSSKDKDRKKRSKDKDKKKSKHKHKDKEKRHKSKKMEKSERSGKKLPSNEEEARRARKKKASQQLQVAGETRRSSQPDNNNAAGGLRGMFGSMKNLKFSQSTSSLVQGQQQDNGRPTPSNHGPNNGASKVGVYYACDETTGACAYHPEVQLRKRHRLGGWKDVLKQCPKCIAAEKAGRHPGPPQTMNGRRRGDVSSRSGSTRTGSTRRTSTLEKQNEGDYRKRPPEQQGMQRRANLASQRQQMQPPKNNRPRKVEVLSDSDSSDAPSKKTLESRKQQSHPQQQQPQQRQERRETVKRRGEAKNAVDPRRERPPSQQPPSQRHPPPHAQQQQQPPVTRPPERVRHRGSSQQPPVTRRPNPQQGRLRSSSAEPGQQQQQQLRARSSSKDPEGRRGQAGQRPQGQWQQQHRRTNSNPVQSQSQGQQPQHRRTASQQNSGAGTRTGRDRAARSERQPDTRQRSVSSQRMILNVVDFDPPPEPGAGRRQRSPSVDPPPSNPYLQKESGQRRANPGIKSRELEELRFSVGSIDDAPAPRPDSVGAMRSREVSMYEASGGSGHVGSESDFALFRDSGGRAYNEEGIFGFFKDDQGNGGKRTQEQQHEQEQDERREFLESRLEALGVTAQDVMNFINSRGGGGGRLDKSVRSGGLGGLERELMEQVARLSIGSVDRDPGQDDGSKLTVLREVVKLYANNYPKDGGTRKDDVVEGSPGRRNRRNGRGPPERHRGGDGGSRQVSFLAGNGSSPRQAPRGAPAEQPKAYGLGDEGRRRDMIKDGDHDVALMRIASLRPGDGAFIRRTTGKWTFSKVKEVTSDSIVFFVNASGSSKAYNVKYWVSHVRTMKALPPPAPKQQRPPPAVDNRGAERGGRRAVFAKQSTESRFSTKMMLSDHRMGEDEDDDDVPRGDPGGKRGAFAKQSSESRFSTKSLLLSEEEDDVQWNPRRR